MVTNTTETIQSPAKSEEPHRLHIITETIINLVGDYLNPKGIEGQINLHRFAFIHNVSSFALGFLSLSQVLPSLPVSGEVNYMKFVNITWGFLFTVGAVIETHLAQKTFHRINEPE